MNMLNLPFGQIMKKLLLSFLAIFLIIEEWLWDLLTVLGRSLFQFLNLEQFEQWLRQTTANMALVALSVPILTVTLINLMAFGLIAKGLVLQGILTEVFAKLIGTLLVARVFALTKPQLLTFAFLRVTYTTIIYWLQWAHQKITDTAIYRWAKQWKT
jgi:hypothetical protein